jgi:nucleotide-binding universal stress UspA family protein
MSQTSFVAASAIQFRRILFATDFSPASARALPYAAAIARRFGSTIYFSHVISPESYSHIPMGARESAVARMREEAENRITELLWRAHFKGVPHHVVINHGDIWPVLSTIAEQYDVDVIVAGTHGRHGFQKLIEGSVAEEILRLAPRPALLIGPEVTIEPEAEVHLERILYVTDFSPESKRAMNYAYALAKAYGAHLFFLYIVENAWAEPLSAKPADFFFRERLFERNWPQSAEGIEPEFLVEFGAPEALTLQVANQRGAQLIVLNVPTAVHPDLEAHLPGPLAYNIVSHARCPVFGIRGGVEAGDIVESHNQSAAD